MTWLSKDPLARLKIRYKLPLSFVVVSLIAFGIGGVLIIKTVNKSLFTEIQTRLKSETIAQASVFDQHLLMLGRRTQDFASDGFIRTQTELIEASPDPDEATKSRLIDHLRTNKLPIVEEFTNLLVFDENGNLLVSAYPVEQGLRDLVSEGFNQDALWYSPLFHSLSDPVTPRFTVITPLITLHQTKRIGYLVCVVDFKRVLAYLSDQYQNAMSFSDVEKYLTIIDQTGGTLDIPWWTFNHRENLQLLDLSIRKERTGISHSIVTHEGRHACQNGQDVFGFGFPLRSVNWTIIVDLGTNNALKTISALEEKLFLGGAAIAFLILITMYFPVRFIIRPLNELESMAFTIKEGDYSARVVTQSEDEIGDLASSFNQMAEALEERTTVLQKTAGDLAEREKEIRIQHDRLKTVVSSMNDGLILLNDAGEIVLHNDAGKPLVRHLFEKDNRIDVVECINIDPSGSRPCIDCLLDLSSLQACTLKMENRYFEVLSTKLPGMSSGAGKILVSRDITERLLMNEKQSRQERLAVLGNIAAVVAHEMNSPLAAISMYNQMLAEDFDPKSPYSEHIDVIRRNTETCREIITNLLDFARTPTLNISSVDIHELINQTIRLLVPLHGKANMTIRLSLNATDFRVEGDLSRLKQIFANLILNAIQAVKDTGGSMIISSRKEPADGVLIIDIEDSGPGIAPEIVCDIFNPFFTTRESDMGTGLGLSTAKRIAEAHGGSVDLVQNQPLPTIFRITLPHRFNRNREFNPTEWSG